MASLLRCLEKGYVAAETDEEYMDATSKADKALGECFCILE